jgi:hypothetical protein
MTKDEEPRNYHGSKFCISYAAAKMTKQMKMQEELEWTQQRLPKRRGEEMSGHQVT